MTSHSPKEERRVKIAIWIFSIISASSLCYWISWYTDPIRFKVSPLPICKTHWLMDRRVAFDWDFGEVSIISEKEARLEAGDHPIYQSEICE